MVADVAGDAREFVRCHDVEVASIHAMEHLLVAGPVGILTGQVEIAENFDVVHLEKSTAGCCLHVRRDLCVEFVIGEPTHANIDRRAADAHTRFCGMAVYLSCPFGRRRSNAGGLFVGCYYNRLQSGSAESCARHRKNSFRNRIG
ncbi:MAG: hypothetical protein M3T56_05895 [Chloroflexota bacterium]|nr:hypothetical protein [Chloroflexota bacterium]